jgi:hypothetical protein
MKTLKTKIWLLTAALMAVAVVFTGCPNPASDDGGGGSGDNGGPGGYKGGRLTVAQDGSGDYATIMDALNAASPGDTVTVYPGFYREYVIIPHDNITLKAGGEVVICGSDPVPPEYWEPHSGTTYKATVPKEFFGDAISDFNHKGSNYFNPFAERWMSRGGITPSGKYYTCGNVYIGDTELKQQWSTTSVESNSYTWYAEVDGTDPNTGTHSQMPDTTTIYANFGGADPRNSASRVEINNRMQGITAAWGKKYITIDGFTVIRCCGPKTIDFWKTNAKGMYGAISVYGGYKWEIKNCELYQNRGVAIDFGNGSHDTEIMNGACGVAEEPPLYGYHYIHHNYIHDNAVNAAFAYRGPYTEIAYNRMINNNTLEAGLLSDAYIKDVNGGWGCKVHHNYILSDRPTSSAMRAIWPDSECDFWEITNNVIIDLTGTGLSSLTDECNHGYMLYANNIFMGINYEHGAGNQGHAYLVNNLFLNSGSGAAGTGWSWGWNDNSPSARPGTNGGSEGNDGWQRAMKLKIPGTLTTLSPNGSAKFRLECLNRYNRLEGNIFYDSGVNISGSANEKELSTIISRMGFTGVDYNSNNLQDGSPSAWQYVWGLPIGQAVLSYGNSVDYNVYYKNARKVARQLNQFDRTDDLHSIVAAPNTDANPKSTFGTYSISANENGCTLTLVVDESINQVNAPMMTGQYMGKVTAYAALGVDLYAPDIDKDYFGKSRGSGSTTIPGPFADLKSGFNTYTLWPIN